jgi:hypothetical protein
MTEAAACGAANSPSGPCRSSDLPVALTIWRRVSRCHGAGVIVVPGRLSRWPGDVLSGAGLVSQACVTCLDDGLCPVGDLQLGQDVGHVVADRLLPIDSGPRSAGLGPVAGRYRAPDGFDRPAPRRSPASGTREPGSSARKPKSWRVTGLTPMAARCHWGSSPRHGCGRSTTASGPGWRAGTGKCSTRSLRSRPSTSMGRSASWQASRIGVIARVEDHQDGRDRTAGLSLTGKSHLSWARGSGLAWCARTGLAYGDDGLVRRRLRRG